MEICVQYACAIVCVCVCFFSVLLVCLSIIVHHLKLKLMMQVDELN